MHLSIFVGMCVTCYALGNVLNTRFTKMSYIGPLPSTDLDFCVEDSKKYITMLCAKNHSTHTLGIQQKYKSRVLTQHGDFESGNTFRVSLELGLERQFGGSHTDGFRSFSRQRNNMQTDMETQKPKGVLGTTNSSQFGMAKGGSLCGSIQR